MKSSRDVNKLIHDINASISTLGQSLNLLNENFKQEPEVAEKIIPLCVDKIEELERLWKEIKSIIK